MFFKDKFVCNRVNLSDFLDSTQSSPLEITPLDKLEIIEDNQISHSGNSELDLPENDYSSQLTTPSDTSQNSNPINAAIIELTKLKKKISPDEDESPNRWYSANSVMEVANNYITSFEAAKYSDDQEDKTKRELTNYYLIQAYLKCLDEQNDQCSDENNNGKQKFGSMPDLNWTNKITSKALDIVKSNLSNCNKKSQDNLSKNEKSKNFDTKNLNMIKDHLHEVAEDLKKSLASNDLSAYDNTLSKLKKLISKFY